MYFVLDTRGIECIVSTFIVHKLFQFQLWNGFYCAQIISVSTLECLSFSNMKIHYIVNKAA